MKKLDLQSLPNDIGELKSLIVQLAAERDEKIELLESRIESERSERIEQQNKALGYFEELQQLRRRLFGRSAERLTEEDKRQQLLFNEAELIASRSGPCSHASQTRTQAASCRSAAGDTGSRHS